MQQSNRSPDSKRPASSLASLPQSSHDATIADISRLRADLNALEALITQRNDTDAMQSNETMLRREQAERLQRMEAIKQRLLSRTAALDLHRRISVRVNWAYGRAEERVLLELEDATVLKLKQELAEREWHDSLRHYVIGIDRYKWQQLSLVLDDSELLTAKTAKSAPITVIPSANFRPTMPVTIEMRDHAHPAQMILDHDFPTDISLALFCQRAADFINYKLSSKWEELPDAWKLTTDYSLAHGTLDVCTDTCDIQDSVMEHVKPGSRIFAWVAEKPEFDSDLDGVDEPLPPLVESEEEVEGREDAKLRSSCKERGVRKKRKERKEPAAPQGSQEYQVPQVPEVSGELVIRVRRS